MLSLFIDSVLIVYLFLSSLTIVTQNNHFLISMDGDFDVPNLGSTVFRNTQDTFFFTRTKQTEKCVDGGGMEKKKADI